MLTTFVFSAVRWPRGNVAGRPGRGLPCDVDFIRIIVTFGLLAGLHSDGDNAVGFAAGVVGDGESSQLHGGRASTSRSLEAGW